MSSSQEFLGCTITKKVEEHCIRLFSMKEMIKLDSYRKAKEGKVLKEYWFDYWSISFFNF